MTNQLLGKYKIHSTLKKLELDLENEYRGVVDKKIIQDYIYRVNVVHGDGFCNLSEATTWVKRKVRETSCISTDT